MRDNIMHHQMHTLDSPSVITFSTERPRMLVSWSFIAQNAPTESCRCTTRIPWYHQNPAYTHRILFALTACRRQVCCKCAESILHHGTWPRQQHNIKFSRMIVGPARRVGYYLAPEATGTLCYWRVRKCQHLWLKQRVLHRSPWVFTYQTENWKGSPKTTELFSVYYKREL